MDSHERPKCWNVCCCCCARKHSQRRSASGAKSLLDKNSFVFVSFGAWKKFAREKNTIKFQQLYLEVAYLVDCCLVVLFVVLLDMQDRFECWFTCCFLVNSVCKVVTMCVTTCPDQKKVLFHLVGVFSFWHEGSCFEVSELFLLSSGWLACFFANENSCVSPRRHVQKLFARSQNSFFELLQGPKFRFRALARSRNSFLRSLEVQN